MSLSLLTLAAQAAIAAPPDGPLGPPTPAAHSRYVLVSSEAWFYQAASAKAERFNLGLAPGAAPSGHLSMGARLELVAERGDWLEVAVPEPGPAHCVDVPSALRIYRMKLFVERAAVLPVVTRDGVVAFPGGSVSVKAGRWADVRDRAVALWSGRPRGSAGDETRPIPDDLIGTAYTAGPLAPPLPGLTYYIAEDAVYYDGWTPESGGGATMAVVAFAPNPGPGHTGDAAVILRERCEERPRTVRVVGHPGGPPATSLRPASNDNPLFAMLAGGDEPSDPEPGPPPLPKIRAGAQVYWPGGAPAGVTRDTATPDLEVPAHSGRRCFASFAFRVMDEVPTLATTPALTFCYRPGDLEAPAP